MNISVFNFDNYRSFLKASVKAEKNSWGLWAKLAKAAQCQPTYLTQSMRGKANLTADHLLGISLYLKLSTEETDFFLLLLELERAGSQQLKKYLLEKIKKIRAERDDLSKRLALPRLEIGEKETLYYSAWYWSALHVMVSIPEYQTAEAMARRLQLPVGLVEEALHHLSRFNIIKREGRNWKLGTADIHIPKTSPLIGVHHNNWRQRAVLSSTLPQNPGVHYTAVYSLSEADFKHLKEKLNEFVEYTRKVVRPSKEEALVTFACDLFEV